MDIRIIKNPSPSEKPDENALGFGLTYTDHMFIMDYNRSVGWHNARIVPFGPLEIHPAAVVLHYGAEVFEGLKAYRAADGTVRLFRPLDNIRRMNDSAERLCLPVIDEDDAMQALVEFVRLEQDFVPHKSGTSLYIRPFMIATEANLGLHGINEASFIIIASPRGSYYKEGISPVSIMIETEDVRAVKGGTGYAKCGGNYAASTRAGERAEKLGFSQVLWLDGVERKYIEEVGSMNVMFKIAGKVITPDLIGTVLPGITRRSILEMLRDEGYEVEERRISVEEIINALENGTLEEAFGCGTAAVVSPMGKLVFNGREYTINNNEIGPLTAHLYDTLTGIQWGRLEDTKGWVLTI